MSAATKLSVFVGFILGTCFAAIGYTVGGLPGEIVGVCVAMIASVFFGTWVGTRW